MRRLFAVSLLISFAGCRCLEPVYEGEDGGAGGGTATGGGSSNGGGTSSGGGSALGGGGGSTGECNTNTDCTAAAPVDTLCNVNETMRGYSCIDHRCVYECDHSRTCDFNTDGGCLRCTAPAASACTNVMCGAMAYQAEVEQTAGCDAPFDLVTLFPTGGCRYRAVQADGGEVGVFTQTGASIVGELPGLGTCVGASLFTQIERWRFACPSGCQFTLRL